ncbi:MAG: FCD domain-containing protein [Eubacteriales bacterium]
MNRVKLVDVASESIIQMIKNKEYDQDGYLLSEGDLALKLEVSRSTIREAVRSLEVRGFLHRRHGKGLEVANNSTEVMTRSLEDMLIKEVDIMDDLLEIRMLLEPACAELAANTATAKDLADMEKFIQIMESKDVADEDYYVADLGFHCVMARASGNRIYESIITAYTPILLEMIVESSPNQCRYEPEFHYHRNILEAVKSRDGEKAKEEMTNHLRATDKNRNSSS